MICREPLRRRPSVNQRTRISTTPNAATPYESIAHGTSAESGASVRPIAMSRGLPNTAAKPPMEASRARSGATPQAMCHHGVLASSSASLDHASTWASRTSSPCGADRLTRRAHRPGLRGRGPISGSDMLLSLLSALDVDHDEREHDDEHRCEAEDERARPLEICAKLGIAGTSSAILATHQLPSPRTGHRGGEFFDELPLRVPPALAARHHRSAREEVEVPVLELDVEEPSDSLEQLHRLGVEEASGDLVAAVGHEDTCPAS